MFRLLWTEQPAQQTSGMITAFSNSGQFLSKLIISDPRKRNSQFQSTRNGLSSNSCYFCSFHVQKTKAYNFQSIETFVDIARGLTKLPLDRPQISMCHNQCCRWSLQFHTTTVFLLPTNLIMIDFA